MTLNRIQDSMFDNSTTLTTNSKSVKGAINEVESQLNTVTQCSITYNGVTTTFLNQTTNLYIAPDSSVVSGSNGLSSSAPIKLSDIQTIFNALALSFPTLMGTWTVNFTAGTYQSSGTDHMLNLVDIPSTNYIQFFGPDVGVKGTVPTAILDGKINGNTYTHGLYFAGMKVFVKNIKFQNFTESTTPNVTTGSRGGLVFSGNYGKIYAYNVHTYNCSWGGIVNQGIPRLYVEGGRYEYCRYGVLSMFNTEVSIGYNGSSSYPDSQNTNFVNCTESGVQIQSQTNGHIDYSIFSNNTNKCIVMDTMCEINGVSNKFTSNNICISAQGYSRYLNTNNIFGTTNTQLYETYYGGLIEFNQTPDPFKGRPVYQLSEDATNFLTAQTTPGTLWSKQFTPDMFNGRGKTLHLVVYGRLQNNGTNTSNINIRVQDSASTPNNNIVSSIAVPATNGYVPFKFELYLSNWTKTAFYYNDNFSQSGSNIVIDNNGNVVADSTTAITLSLEWTQTGTGTSEVDIYRLIPQVML